VSWLAFLLCFTGVAIDGDNQKIPQNTGDPTRRASEDKLNHGFIPFNISALQSFQPWMY
jgi:hypothetical protein